MPALRCGEGCASTPPACCRSFRSSLWKASDTASLNGGGASTSNDSAGNPSPLGRVIWEISTSCSTQTTAGRAGRNASSAGPSGQKASGIGQLGPFARPPRFMRKRRYALGGERTCRAIATSGSAAPAGRDSKSTAPAGTALWKQASTPCSTPFMVRAWRTRPPVSAHRAPRGPAAAGARSTSGGPRGSRPRAARGSASAWMCSRQMRWSHRTPPRKRSAAGSGGSRKSSGASPARFEGAEGPPEGPAAPSSEPSARMSMSEGSNAPGLHPRPKLSAPERSRRAVANSRARHRPAPCPPVPPARTPRSRASPSAKEPPPASRVSAGPPRGWKATTSAPRADPAGGRREGSPAARPPAATAANGPRRSAPVSSASRCAPAFAASSTATPPGPLWAADAEASTTATTTPPPTPRRRAPLRLHAPRARRAQPRPERLLPPGGGEDLAGGASAGTLEGGVRRGGREGRGGGRALPVVELGTRLPAG